MKKVVVLGGSGFVGTQVCTQLVAQGWQVTVPSRARAHGGHLLALPSLNVLEVDVHDEQALCDTLAGHEAVVNLVAILHGSKQAFEKVHVALPQKIVRACLAARIAQVVHLSALGVDAVQPEAAPSMYLRSKGQGEAALMRAARSGAGAAFALTILRPSVIFGAGDKFLNVFAQLQRVLPLMPLAGANARFQPVWVQDVASAVLRSLELANLGAPKVFELCGPEVFTLRELVQLAAQFSGIRGGRGRPVIALPHWAGYLQTRLMELAPGEPLMSRDNLDLMQRDNVASGTLPGLQSLGIAPSALRPIAQNYLKQNQRT